MSSVVRGKAKVAELEDLSLGGTNYLSNATCLRWPRLFVYGIACLIRLVESATLFVTFEESVCYTSNVRRVVAPDWQKAQKDCVKASGGGEVGTSSEVPFIVCRESC